MAFTDDDAPGLAEEFVEQLVALSPEQFGTSPEHPTFAFHSIIGIAEREPAWTAYAPREPIVTTRCSNEQRTAPSAGDGDPGLRLQRVHRLR